METYLMKKETGSKKKILCSCGTGIATCSYISSEVEKFLRDNDIDAEIINCRASEIESCYEEADLIISTCQLPPRIDRPRVSGIPFITGNNLEDTKLQILKLLR